jgi:RNA polymerase sigma-70 factor (ECF subfamily)
VWRKKRSLIRDALRSLPEPDRELLMLVAWDGLDARRAAAVIGCTPAAFSVRLHRARKRFERALQHGEADQRVFLPAVEEVAR